jgi:hypothetical protein
VTARLHPRPRTPGLVYTALALVLVILVAVIATTATQPPPPTIAEFAPQAVEQIKEAPREQSGDFGEEDGGDGGLGAAAPSPPTVTPPPIDVPRVRRCVGNPPRQIEDPQSPPCVAYWEGNNRGVTYQGVTRDTIRIKVPLYDGLQNDGFHEALQNFFNARFEFYGRKLDLFLGQAPTGPTPEQQTADAQNADEDEQVFASTTGGAGAYFYHKELARRKIVSVPILSTSFSEPELQQLHPYVWEYQMATDRQLEWLGDWACARLGTGNAVHAGNDLQDTKRVYGAILDHVFPDDTITFKPLQRELEQCGVKLAATYEFTSGDAFADPGGTPQRSSHSTNAVIRMKSAGVTSVFCICVFTEFATIARAATAQAYFPEWMITSYHFMDYNAGIGVLAGQASEQLEHTFGLSFNPMQRPPDETPVVWAVREGDPSYTFPDYSTTFAAAIYAYRELLALASGIQMAGPNLTPETFARGMQRTKFPNPFSPLMAGNVGFAGDHEMTDDAAEIWWSNSAASPYEMTGGAYCYVDGGKRKRKGGWGKGDPLFKEPCVSGAGS